MSFLLAALGAAAAATVVLGAMMLVQRLGAGSGPTIAGLAEMPGGLPVVGNLLQLGTEHARVARRWGRHLGPVFQARLGAKRVVFVNSYEAARHFWISNQSALISRPTFYTFHSVVSATQGFSIGSSPWDESCKRRRRAAATALNRRAMQGYMAILDGESTACVRELLGDSGEGRALDPRPYLQRFSLNCALGLAYGFGIEGGVGSERLREMAEVEAAIAGLRSTSNNWQDYIPLLRLWRRPDARAQCYRVRRDGYMNGLRAELEERIARGTDVPCIIGNIVKDPEAKLKEAEIKSICLSVVSAGLDTVAVHLLLGLAYLSTADGQEVQRKALRAIQEAYPDDDAWEGSLADERVAYVRALVQETLRYWSAIPIGLPRESVREIRYGEAVIPAGTTFLLNTYAADYDEARFRMANQFMPERYLEDEAGGGPPHFGYGAGSRMCVGWQLANRELYVAYVRLISAFAIGSGPEAGSGPIIDALDCNQRPTSLTTSPKPFKVVLRVRDRERLRGWMAAAEKRTAGMGMG